jgi:hypothetical protein
MDTRFTAGDAADAADDASDRAAYPTIQAANVNDRMSDVGRALRITAR